MMKLKYTILYVKDVPASLAFYRDAFGLQTAMLHEGGDYGELETGATKLAFGSLALMGQLGKGAVSPTPGQPSFEIAFETEDVNGALARALDAGAALVQPAEQMPWGQTTAYVHDIDGFLVEICSPVLVGNDSSDGDNGRDGNDRSDVADVTESSGNP